MTFPRVLIVTAIATIAYGCVSTSDVEPTWIQPQLVPLGWVSDYDYKSNLQLYLRDQYELARERKMTAYVYLYNQGGEHCLHIRKLMQKKRIRAAFGGAHIVMLDYQRIKWIYKRYPNRSFGPGDWVPVIVKLSSDGNVDTDAIIYPDVYIFHPSLIRDPGLPSYRKSKQLGLTEGNYARRMQRFFTNHDET